MKKIYFTVGPSQIFPTVPSHLKTALDSDVLSMLHRGVPFRQLYKETVINLKKLLKIPADYHVVFVSSGHEAMERIIQSMSHNVTFHINSGFFGLMWEKIATDLGRSAQNFEFFDREKLQFSKTRFEDIKIPSKSELVCITQNDTSVGLSIPMGEIYKLKRKYSEKLFALDVVSAVPYVDIEYKYLDAVFFSVQKGFGLPAGLGVLILSPKAIKRAQKLSRLKGHSIGSYHSLIKMAENSKKFQTVETPNVLGIYLLGAIIKDFLKIGIKSIRKQTDEKSEMLYSFFSKPESYKDIQDVVGEPFIERKEYRSVTTPVFEIKGGSSEALRNFTAEKGLILGAGYGEFKNQHVRIANFPALTIDDTKKLIKVCKKFTF